MNDRNDERRGTQWTSQFVERETEKVSRANEALASLQHLSARWWNFTVSHCTFDLVIGDPLGGEDNIVICCPDTKRVSGPVDWPNQQLYVELSVDYNDPESNWEYRIVDENVGFDLQTGIFLWRRKFDIHYFNSIWFAKGGAPMRHLEFTCPSCEHAAYGYHPFCAECGHRLPTEAKMYLIGLTRPVDDPSHILQIGFDVVRSSVEVGAFASDANGAESNHVGD